MLFVSTLAKARIEVSLLTCQPHDEVYSLYGHTAIRVHNLETGADIAVNYGVFDPRTDFFVMRFVFGLTDYSLGICSYKDFLDEYRQYGSGVYEQRLNMSDEEKKNFLEALLVNSRPENVVYRYNYFYNNCTTKARDILLDAYPGDVKYSSNKYQQGECSFRELVRMKTSEHRWAQWGNDLLLGVMADVNTEHDERQFLPEVLAADFDSAKIIYSGGSEKPLVDSTFWALQPGKTWKNPDTLNFPLTPLQLSWVVLLVIILYLMIEIFVTHRPLLWVHYSFSCLYAVVGVLLFLMLFSQHPTVRLNFQIFIFNPLFFVFAYPKVLKKWGKYAIISSIIIFFSGNIFQSYAEGVNILAIALILMQLALCSRKLCIFK